MSETLQPALLPVSLSRLQRASEGPERDNAWAGFAEAHSDVVVHVCRSLAHDHDAAMDAYAFVLEALRGDDCRRLRAYVPDGKTKFTTWLVVVTRRLVLDHLRQRYGRSRSSDEGRRADSATRRNLEDLVAAELDPEQIESPGASPDAAVRRAELTSAVRSAIEQLSAADRLLLALRFADERPVREIARILGLRSVFHVYRRLGVVLSQLREGLARRGVAGAEP